MALPIRNTPSMVGACVAEVKPWGPLKIPPPKTEFHSPPVPMNSQSSPQNIELRNHESPNISAGEGIRTSAAAEGRGLDWSYEPRSTNVRHFLCPPDFFPLCQLTSYCQLAPPMVAYFAIIPAPILRLLLCCGQE